jgi:hypothetical protein
MPVLIDNCRLNNIDPDKHCAKMLWGTELTPESQGTFDVIIGADIIYEDAYVEPLFATASHYLKREDSTTAAAGEDDYAIPVFLLAYTKRNVSIDHVLDCASRVGFEWTPPKGEEGIYSFTFAQERV